MTAFELIIEYCVKRQNSALSFTNSWPAACVFSDNDFHPCHDVSTSGEQGDGVLKVVLSLWNSDEVEGAMYVGMVPLTYLHGILGDDICAAAIYRHLASVVLL